MTLPEAQDILVLTDPCLMLEGMIIYHRHRSMPHPFFQSRELHPRASRPLLVMFLIKRPLAQVPILSQHIIITSIATSTALDGSGQDAEMPVIVI